MNNVISVVDSVRTDLVRKYWDKQPCNVKHSSAPVGSRRWSAEVLSRKYFVEPHIKPFAEFKKWTDKKVLEIGCGIGSDTMEFAWVGAVIDAVDASLEAIKLATVRFSYVKDVCLTEPNFFQANAELGLPELKDNSYDLVYSFGVIHHTVHPEFVVDTAFKKLAPGGEFRLMLYSKWSLKNLFGKQYEAQAGCPIVGKYTKKTVKKLLNQFEILSVKKTFIFPWRLKEYKKYQYKKSFPYSITPRWLFNFLQKTLGEHLLIVCRKPVQG